MYNYVRIARTIIDYSSETVLGRLLIAELLLEKDRAKSETSGFLLVDRRLEIDSYKDDYRRMKETFDWCVKTKMWKTVLKIGMK